MSPGTDHQPLGRFLGPRQRLVVHGDLTRPGVIPARDMKHRNVGIVVDVINDRHSLRVPERRLGSAAHRLDQPGLVLGHDPQRRRPRAKRQAVGVLTDPQPALHLPARARAYPPSRDQELPSDNAPFFPVVDVLMNDRIVDHRLSCLPQSCGKPDPSPSRLARWWGYSPSSILNRCEVGMNPATNQAQERPSRPRTATASRSGTIARVAELQPSTMLDGSTQTTPPAQNPNSLASLWSSAQELAESCRVDVSDKSPE